MNRFSIADNSKFPAPARLAPAVGKRQLAGNGPMYPYIGLFFLPHQNIRVGVPTKKIVVLHKFSKKLQYWQHNNLITR